MAGTKTAALILHFPAIMVHRLGCRILALVLIALSVNSALAEPTYVRFDANSCHLPGDAKAWGLTDQQVDTLCKASFYNVTLLRKGSQFIVLVGEWHKITKLGTQQAQAILSLFPFRSFEQAPEEIGTLVQPTLSKFISPEEQPPQEAFELYNFPALTKSMTNEGLAVWTYEKPEYNGLREGKEYGEFMSKFSRQPSKNWGHPGYFHKRVNPEFRKAYPSVPLSINLETNDKLYNNRSLERAEDLCAKAGAMCWDSYIIDYRNSVMREMANEILKQFPEEKVMLMGVGMAHVLSLVRSFVCTDGYERHTLSMRGKFNVAQGIYALHLRYKTNQQGPAPQTEFYEWPEVNCSND